ncbi:major facilitator superfamily protein [Deinococcus aerius]|uniref:Major facilitator superfamily protein n=1 Tax=Deinococcus aerius TaxID=200253 RepID=A0A2I9DIZ0_9DEIO|nr:MFS transporter [Deinococcus aerius]GBF06258.1 major facilitator superfamily protein [Deinococcus aerius]
MSGEGLTESTPALAGRRTALLVLGLVLVALNLRPSLAGFGPLLGQIQAELGVSAATVSLLTTIPLLCWGLLAPLAPLLTRWRSSETVVLLSTGLIGVGALLRVGPTLGWILPGTVLVGAGIALNNVLLPSLVRRDFPRQVGLMTGVYTLAVVGGAAMASGLAVPLRRAFGGEWRASLGVWAGLALLGMLAWLPVLFGRQTRGGWGAPAGTSVWRNPYAPPVTLFMGFQALVFFTWLTWLPRVLQDRGLSPEASGLLLALGNLVQLPFSLGVPVLAARLRGARPLVVAISGLIAAGLLGLLLLPAAPPLPWVLLLGMGSGSTFPLALVFIALRASNPAQVPRLSALAQGVGYLLAASGPFLFGALHDRTAAWTTPLWFLVGCTGLVLLAGLWATRAEPSTRR